MTSPPQWVRSLGNTDDGLFIVDAKQRIVHWNPGAQRLFGYSAEEVLKQRCFDAIAGRTCPGKAWCHSNCSVQRALRRGATHRNFDLLVRTKDGREIYTNVSIIILAHAGKTFSLHLARDITRMERDKETVQAILDALRTTGNLERENGLTIEPSTNGASPSMPLSRLTRREVEVLSLVAEGLPGSAIARRLGLSPYTVRNHIQNTLEKLRLHNKAQAVSYAFRNGLV